MQAITTRYLPCTNCRGSRIKAECERGSITVSWDDSLNLSDLSATRLYSLPSEVCRTPSLRGTGPLIWNIPQSLSSPSILMVMVTVMKSFFLLMNSNLFPPIVPNARGPRKRKESFSEAIKKIESNNLYSDNPIFVQFRILLCSISDIYEF